MFEVLTQICKTQNKHIITIFWHFWPCNVSCTSEGCEVFNLIFNYFRIQSTKTRDFIMYSHLITCWTVSQLGLKYGTFEIIQIQQTYSVKATLNFGNKSKFKFRYSLINKSVNYSMLNKHLLLSACQSHNTVFVYLILSHMNYHLIYTIHLVSVVSPLFKHWVARRATG